MPVCLALPTILRSVPVASMPDTDWAATQTAPSASICVDVTNVNTIGVAFKAKTAAGVIVNPSGTISAACIDVAVTPAIGGLAAGTLIETTPLDTLVSAGAGLTYDVRGRKLITIRVAAQALGGTVSYIEIFTHAID